METDDTVMLRRLDNCVELPRMFIASTAIVEFGVTIVVVTCVEHTSWYPVLGWHAGTVAAER